MELQVPGRDSVPFYHYSKLMRKAKTEEDGDEFAFAAVQ
jgi:hypothetical protein